MVDPTPDDPQTLLFETSPIGTLDALVQHDGRAVYLFLSDNDRRFGTRACWVRNLAPGPMVLTPQELQAGIPPPLPRTFCRHPNGAALPDPETLRILWFEEGNAAALLEHDEPLALIPPWSGREGFHGYARDCLFESPIAWPWPSRPELDRRLKRADAFWKQARFGRLPDILRQQLEAAYTAAWGSPLHVTQLPRPPLTPLAIYEFRNGDQGLWVTAGVSLCPQPNVEIDQPHPASLRRIEWALRPPADGSAESLRTVARSLLESLARTPWSEWVYFLPEQVVLNPVPGTPWGDRVKLRGSRLLADGADVRFWDDPVRLLWIEPHAAETARGEAPI